MLFTIPETAQIIGLSKQGLYKKIKRMDNEFTKFTVQDNGIMKITQEGVNLLKSKPTVSESDSKLYRDKLINTLQEQVNQLTKALENEKSEKNNLYALILQEKQEKQLLLESAADKENNKSFWTKLFRK